MCATNGMVSERASHRTHDSVCVIHICTFPTYIYFELVRWRKTWFAPNRIEFGRHKRNNTRAENKSRYRQLRFFFICYFCCAFSRFARLGCFFVPVFFFFVALSNMDLIRTNSLCVCVCKRHNQNAIPIVKYINVMAALLPVPITLFLRGFSRSSLCLRSTHLAGAADVSDEKCTNVHWCC